MTKRMDNDIREYQNYRVSNVEISPDGYADVRFEPHPRSSFCVRISSADMHIFLGEIMKCNNFIVDTDEGELRSEYHREAHKLISFCDEADDGGHFYGERARDKELS